MSTILVLLLSAVGVVTWSRVDTLKTRLNNCGVTKWQEKLRKQIRTSKIIATTVTVIAVAVTVIDLLAD